MGDSFKRDFVVDGLISKHDYFVASSLICGGINLVITLPVISGVNGVVISLLSEKSGVLFVNGERDASICVLHRLVVSPKSSTPIFRTTIRCASKRPQI